MWHSVAYLDLLDLCYVMSACHVRVLVYCAPCMQHERHTSSTKPFSQTHVPTTRAQNDKVECHLSKSRLLRTRHCDEDTIMTSSRTKVSGESVAKVRKSSSSCFILMSLMHPATTRPGSLLLGEPAGEPQNPFGLLVCLRCHLLFFFYRGFRGCRDVWFVLVMLLIFPFLSLFLTLLGMFILSVFCLSFVWLPVG